jgi:ABC-2 type transport system permease protein
MDNISDTLAVAWKEIQLIIKDRGSLAILFMLPLLIGSFYGSINLQIEGDGEEPAILLDVLLVNEDDAPFGNQVADALKAIDELDIEEIGSQAQAEERVAIGEGVAAIVIPANFTHKVDSHTPSTIEVIVDPAQPQSASIVTGIMNQVVTEVTIWGEVQFGIRTLLDESGMLADAGEETQRAVEAQNLGVIMTTLNEMRQKPAILVVSEELGGETAEGWVTTYFAYLFPGLTVMFAFFAVGFSGASLLTERDAGTLRRLLAAPLSRSAIIGGKMLAYMLLVCMQVVVLFGVASLFFGMPLGESPLALVLLTLALALVVAAMGMLVASLTKTAGQAENVGRVLGFVLAGIGGAIALTATPLSRTEGFMGVLSKLTPHAHAVEGYYRLMAENAGLTQILPQLSVLLAMGIGFFLIARWRFRFT